MDGQKPNTNVVEPTGPHHSTFILLHERGSSGAELQHILCNALLPAVISQLVPGARFVFPDGPIANPDGSRDWYALEHPGLECGEAGSLDQWRHVMYAAEQVDMVVEDEVRVIGAENVFLGGIGKGSAVAMMTLLEKEHALGGLVGFGGWMPFVRDMKDVATMGKIMSPNPPLSQDQDDGSAMDLDDDLSMFVDPSLFIDPSILGLQDDGQQQQQQQQPRKPSSQPALRPEFDLSDQSTKARHERVANFLRQFEWADPARVRYAQEFSSATPVVLVHSSDDDLVPRPHAKEAQMMLMQLGFHVKLEESACGHVIIKEVVGEFMSTMLDVLPFSNGALRGELMTSLHGTAVL